MTIAGVLAVLRRRWLLVLVCALGAPFVAVMLALRAPEEFTAHAQVLINREDIASLVANIPNSSEFNEAERFGNTNAAIARSPRVANRAAKNSGVEGLRGFELQTLSTVQPAENADLLEFTATSDSAQTSIAVVNAHARAFAAERARLDGAAVTQARKDVEKRLWQLSSQGQSGSAFFATLQEKEQQLETFETLQTSRASVLNEARAATDTRPSVPARAMLALALGLLVGIAGAFVRESLDTRVRSGEEVADTLGLPILARVPTPPDAASDGLSIVLAPDDAYADAIGFLRSSIALLRPSQGPFAVMVTSASPSDGKTTTAANLAASLALDGARVALLEADMRRPRLGEMLGYARQVGLADVLRGQAAVAGALTKVQLVQLARGRGRKRFATLHLISAGSPQRSPAESTTSASFAAVVTELRESHDYVIVDAPPLLATGDALGVSARVDGVVVLCRMNALPRQRLRDLARLLEAVPARRLGIVLTGAEQDPSYHASPYALGRRGRLDLAPFGERASSAMARLRRSDDSEGNG